MLAAHDLFKRLDGNPYMIKSLANFYHNPFVDNSDLKGIYRRLLELDQEDDEESVRASISQKTQELKKMTSKKIETRGKGI